MSAITVALPTESPTLVYTTVGDETILWQKSKGVWWNVGRNGPLYGSTYKIAATTNEAHLLEAILNNHTEALPK